MLDIEYHGSTIDIILYSYEYNFFHKNPSSGLLKRLQSDDYYAFGKRKSGSPVSVNDKYLYNGKEVQDELGE